MVESRRPRRVGRGRLVCTDGGAAPASSRAAGSERTRASAKMRGVAINEPERLDSRLDRVIERYKVDIDRTLIRENLRKTHEERLLTLQRMQGFVDELHAAGKAARRKR